jgi:hypothetical protein
VNFRYAASIGLFNLSPQQAADKLMASPIPELQELGSRFYRQIEPYHLSYEHVGHLLDPEAQRDGRPIEVDNFDKYFGNHFNTFKNNEKVRNADAAAAPSIDDLERIIARVAIQNAENDQIIRKENRVFEEQLAAMNEMFESMRRQG